MSVSQRPFLYDNMGGALKFGLAMVVDVLDTTSSFRFLSDSKQLGGIVLQRVRFVSLFCFVGEG